MKFSIHFGLYDSVYAYFKWERFQSPFLKFNCKDTILLHNVQIIFLNFSQFFWHFQGKPQRHQRYRWKNSEDMHIASQGFFLIWKGNYFHIYRQIANSIRRFWERKAEMIQWGIRVEIRDRNSGNHFRTREEIISMMFMHVQAANDVFEKSVFNGNRTVRFAVKQISVRIFWNFVISVIDT